MSDCIEHTQKAPSYGSGSLRGRRTSLHRVVYCRSSGLTLEDIEGLVVRHRCDNPRCINPEHLEVGTQSDNMLDRSKRGRIVFKRGDSHQLTKASEADVEEARALIAAGNTLASCARSIGVTSGTLHKRLYGRKDGR